MKKIFTIILIAYLLFLVNRLNWYIVESSKNEFMLLIFIPQFVMFYAIGGKLERIHNFIWN